MFARHPKEFLVYNNKPAWGVIIDNTDQAVLHLVRYEKARKADFHHVYYIAPQYLEKMSVGEATFLWGDERGISSFDVVPLAVVNKVKELYNKEN
jgi:hypothetical protein